MINKKFVVALCLGLVSNVAWCNLQTLVTPRGLAHIAGAASGASLAAFCGSPLVHLFVLKQNVDKTYFVKIEYILKKIGIRCPDRLAIPIIVTGIVGGLGIFGYMGNKIREDYQYTEEVSATK